MERMNQFFVLQYCRAENLLEFSIIYIQSELTLLIFQLFNVSDFLVLKVSGSFDFFIRIWNTATGQMKKVLIAHTAPVRSLVALPNGMLVSGGEDVMIKWF